MIYFLIGLIIGAIAVATYFQRIRNGTLLELTDNQVAVFRFVDSPPQVKELSSTIYYFTSPPEVLTLIGSELSYSFSQAGSVLCRDFERLDMP